MAKNTAKDEHNNKLNDIARDYHKGRISRQECRDQMKEENTKYGKK